MKKFKNLLKEYKLTYKEESLSINYNHLTFIKLNGLKLKSVGLNNFKEKQEKLNIEFFNKLNPTDISFVNLSKIDLIITNNIIKKDFFSDNIPILYSDNFNFENNNIQINYKTKKIKRKLKFIYSDIGFGPEFMNIFFPFWEGKKNYNYDSFIKSFLSNIVNLGYPKGLRVRLIFAKIKFKSDIEKIIDFLKKPKVSIIIDGNIIGNMKILYKYNGFFLFNKSILNSILDIKNHFGYEINFLTSIDFDQLTYKNKLIWINPYINDYEFELSEKTVKEKSSLIYSLINTLPKYLLK